MPKDAHELTPMKRQYNQIKEQNQDCILFFRLGDFYEMFDEDARLASRELDLTLTTRDRSKSADEQTPMCGVPYHSVDAYIARLVAKGYKVAICEQTEDPATAKGLVSRDITRIVTPGTVTESCMLEDRRNNYIAAIYGTDTVTGLAFCDISTGAFYTTTCPDAAAAASELGRFAPSEFIRGGSASMHPSINQVLAHHLHSCPGGVIPDSYTEADAADSLQTHFGCHISELGIAGHTEAIIAAGALLQQLRFFAKK